MSVLKIVSGDDLDIPGQISKEDDTPYPIALTATVTAAIRDSEKLLMTPVTLDDADAGSDWSTGAIQFKVPAAQSALLAPAMKSDRVFVAVQIDDVTTGKTTVILTPNLEILQGVIP